MITLGQKIIFLDIDGVLNSNDWYIRTRGKNKKDEGDIDPQAVSYLNEIIKNTSAKIVMSSSWRTDFENSCNLLYEKGLISNSIIGKTPSFVYQCQDDDIRESLCRGNEIKYYIDKNNVTSYVILDDDKDMLLCQKDNFIPIDFMHGLSKHHVESATYILNKK